MAAQLDLDVLEFAVLTGRAGSTRIPTVAAYNRQDPPNVDTGDITAELRAAEQRCRERGLLRPGGRVEDGAFELLRSYRECGVEYDLRFTAQQGDELRACVSETSTGGTRTVVRRGRVTVHPVRPGDAVPALISLLPQHPAMRIRPIQLNLQKVRSAHEEVTRQGAAEDPRAVEHGLRRHGVNLVDYRKAVRLLDTPKLGAGELGATVFGWERREVRGDQTLRILDLEQGRVAVYNGSGQRLVAGCDAGTVKRVLGDIVAEVREENAW
ncbi:ESX secretion-associated protein EspG [Salinifilum ghardaiensis]